MIKCAQQESNWFTSVPRTDWVGKGKKALHPKHYFREFTSDPYCHSGVQMHESFNLQPHLQFGDNIYHFRWKRSSLLFWNYVTRLQKPSFLFLDMESVCSWLVCVCTLCVLFVGADSSLDVGDHAHLDHQHTHLVSPSNTASGRKCSRCVCFCKIEKLWISKLNCFYFWNMDSQFLLL